MGNYTLTVGNIIKDIISNNRYRIIYIKSDMVVLCKLDTTKLILTINSLTALIEKLSLCEISVEEESETKVYDPDKLTEKQLADFEKKKEIIKIIEDEYGPTFMDLSGKSPKAVIDNLITNYQLTRTTIWKIIRDYLQSGLNIYSLISIPNMHRGGYGSYSYTKKTGKTSEFGTYGIPVTNDVISHFDAALDIYKSGRAKSYDKAYNWMLTKYYMVFDNDKPVFTPATERPTFTQFYYYARTHLSQEEKDRIKTSAMEVRNNKRLLLSDVMFGVMGPCDRVQMDECEVDVSLVSSLQENQSVGRPVVYIMMDVFTRLILAIGISFDNNSLVGMTNCFLNLAEDKVEYCKKYGLNVSSSQWPSGYLPNRMLVDRGSEYTSKESARIFNELNITKELVPAGTGSLKGSVEQWFHQYQSNQNAFVERNGYISKRHDSKHHKESCLTIDEFTTMILSYVIYHNTHLIENYPLDADMIKNNVTPIPCELWEYGCQTYGSPRKPTNMKQYCYSLMLTQKATISRKGIKCNDLYYLNINDKELLTKMYEQQNKRGSFECRIDPRDIGSIYYLKDNELQQAPLNDMKHGNADFTGLTLSEWLSIRKFLNRMKAEYKIKETERKAMLQMINTLIVKNAQKNDLTDVSKMRENREFEKHFIENRNSMYLILHDYLLNEVGEAPAIESVNLLEELPISEEYIETEKSDDKTETTVEISKNEEEPHDYTNEEIAKIMQEFHDSQFQ